MDEVLRIASRTLEGKRIGASEFGAFLNGVLTHTENPEGWKTLILSAYKGLNRHCNPTTRFLMMSFYSTIRDDPGVLGLMPRRFCGTFALIEMAYAVESALALKNTGLVTKLSLRLPRAVRDADHPIMKSHLRSLLVECRKQAVR